MSTDKEPGTLIRARWEIPRPHEPPLRGDLRALPGPPPRTAVVVCHGFKGFREWGFFPSLARAIARRGHAAITFDFSHNGVGDDGVDFSALDRFAQNTHSGNIAEIRLVIDALMGSRFSPTPPERLALLGHSRGGAEALVAAEADPRVAALVTWSAISSFEGRWDSEQIAAWGRGETVEILNSRTGQRMPIGPGYWRDLLEHRDTLDVLAAASRLDRPWLIIHGEEDETVPDTDARTLFAAAGDRAELCLIQGGSHTFGAKHPYDGPTPELRVAAQTTLSWLDQQLL